jgi:tetratricopeptide (TPR) repeat protein
MNKSISLILVLAFQPFSMATANDYADALSEFDNKNYQVTIEKLQGMSGTDEQVERLLLLARAQFKNDQFDETEDTLNELLELEPNNAEALYLHGVNYMALLNEVSVFRKMGVAKSALKSWQKAAETDDNHVRSHFAVFSFYANAPGFAGGDLDKARGKLEKIESLSELHGELANGVLKAKDDKPEEAEKHYLRAVELIDDRSAPLYSLGQFYFQSENYEKAVETFQAYQKRPKVWSDPDEATTLLMIANAYTKMGKNDLAKITLSEALKNKPNRRIKELAEKALDDLGG